MANKKAKKKTAVKASKRPAKKKKSQSASGSRKAKPSSKAKAKKSKAKPKTASKRKATLSPKSISATKSAAKKKTTGSIAKVANKPSKAKVSTKGSSARPAAPAAPKRTPNAKVLPRAFLQQLAEAIKNAVVPLIAAAKGRDVIGTATSGDATFELDRVAEKALLTFLKNAKAPVAYYSEDSGYTTFTSGQPTNLLVVDPIDGTRAAKSGFEGCVVSLCSTRVIERPTIADLDNGYVLELLGNRSFYGERGKGARVYVDGHIRKVKPSQDKGLESVAWAMTVPARPASLIFQTAAKLIDLTSLKGGFFSSNSSSYSLTRLLTGQLDASIDFANRFYRDIPKLVEDHFINAGRGTVVGMCPYDFAAALLIAKEAGCTVTDAYGNSFDDVLLLDSDASNHQSIIAAANPKLHASLLKFFDASIVQCEKLLKRSAAAAAKG